MVGFMAREDAEAFLRGMVAPLSKTRRGTPLPGVPFSREAVANAFVMLGLIPESLADEILAQYRPLLTAEGFQIGVLTGELTVRPGAHGYQAAQTAGRPARFAAPAPAGAATGSAEPPWPTPAECYLAELASVTSMSISTGDRTVDLDAAGITAAVAEALLWVGALPPDSALLSDAGASLNVGARRSGWRKELAHRWVRQAGHQAHSVAPDQADRADPAVGLPLRRATAVIESITAHEDMVSIQLYGHPWVHGEYWPMITPCFQVRAVDDAGGEYEGIRGSGGGSPEASFEFTFYPPVGLAVRRLRVIVSTLWEAAYAEIDIPGRRS
jgi:hypothetical protein